MEDVGKVDPRPVKELQHRWKLYILPDDYSAGKEVWDNVDKVFWDDGDYVQLKVGDMK